MIKTPVREAQWLVELTHDEGKRYNGFAYFVPRGSIPPYPGHHILEDFLDENYPTARYRRATRYLDKHKMFDGTVLSIEFETEEDAMLFKLQKIG
jgi:hypothetical protein